jgi:midasin (ATPase involved in ribosome maturation)
MAEEEYEIERLRAHTVQQGQHLYLVKWKGFPSSESTWEPEESLPMALVTAFSEKNAASARMRTQQALAQSLSTTVDRIDAATVTDGQLVYEIRTKSRKVRRVNAKEYREENPAAVICFIQELGMLDRLL